MRRIKRDAEAHNKQKYHHFPDSKAQPISTGDILVGNLCTVVDGMEKDARKVQLVPRFKKSEGSIATSFF